MSHRVSTLVEYERLYFAGEGTGRDHIVTWTTEIAQEQDKKITNLKNQTRIKAATKDKEIQQFLFSQVYCLIITTPLPLFYMKIPVYPEANFVFRILFNSFIPFWK